MSIKDVLVGYLFKDPTREHEELKSVTPEPNDGSTVQTTEDGIEYNTGAYGGMGIAGYNNFDADYTSYPEDQLITEYRKLSRKPEVEKAIDIIINEMISTSEDTPVSLNLDKIEEYNDPLKKKIIEEFDYVLGLLNFHTHGYRILKQWYIDGRMYYQCVVNKETYKEKGIGKLVYLDPRRVKKNRVVNRSKDDRTGAILYDEIDEFYTYMEGGISGAYGAIDTSGVRLSKDAVASTTSGELSPDNNVILSFLHKAMAPYNMLSSLETSKLIYVISRAPERRVFYINVGDLPTPKAEQHLQRQMQRYKSKPVYDVTNGGVKNIPNVMTMVEDYWLARNSDGKGTEISTLPSGGSLGEMEEVQYFLNKLYNALNVPVTRMSPDAGFSIGRSTEISRDEAALIKFVSELRRRFSVLFNELLKRQLVLKGILNNEEFERIRDNISYEFASDNAFAELKNLELMQGRVDMLDRLSPHVGTYFSREKIFTEVLMMTTEEMLKEKERMEKERLSGEYDQAIDQEGNPVQPSSLSRVIYSSDKKQTSVNTPKAPAEKADPTEPAKPQQAEPIK